MTRRVGAHAIAGRAAMGEDLGLFRSPGKVSGTAPKSASNASFPGGLMVGRSPYTPEVRVRIPVGEPRISGTSAALTAPVPDHNTGIRPLSRDRFYIALSGLPFNSGIRPHEYP